MRAEGARRASAKLIHAIAVEKFGGQAGMFARASRLAGAGAPGCCPAVQRHVKAAYGIDRGLRGPGPGLTLSRRDRAAGVPLPRRPKWRRSVGPAPPPRRASAAHAHPVAHRLVHAEYPLQYGRSATAPHHSFDRLNNAIRPPLARPSNADGICTRLRSGHTANETNLQTMTQRGAGSRTIQ